MFLAHPKCASTRFRSSVAKAIFTVPALSFISSAFVAIRTALMSRNRRTMMILLAARIAPHVRRGLVNLRHEDVPDLEHEVARAAIADRKFVRRAEPVEGGEAVAEQWNAKPLGHLAPMAMRHDQVAVR